MAKLQSVSSHVLWWAEFGEHEAYLQTAPSLKLCGLLIEIAAEPERIEG